MKNAKSNILILFILLVISLKAKQPDSIQYYSNNYDYLEYNSNLTTIPYGEWHTMGSWSYFGLPSYSGKYYYNGLKIRDPLFGAIPVSWLNARNRKINYHKNSLYIDSQKIDNEKLYSKFNYYQGDYSFKNFSLVAGKKVNDKFSWTLYGNNLGYDGGYALYGPIYNEVGESVSQTYHLDCFFNLEKWKAAGGISYAKFRPGMLDYQETYYSSTQKLLQLQHSGNLRESKINNYILLQHKGSDSTEIGINLSNYFYRFHHSTFPLRAEGNSISGKFQRFFWLGNNRFKVKLEPLLQQIHYKFHGSKNQNTITGQIQYADSVFSGNLSISLGATNLTPIYNVKYIKSILPGLAFKLASSHHFFHYPLSYYAPTQLNKDKFYEDNSSYSLHAAGLNYNSTNISNRFQISYIYSDFQYPFQTSATDSIINYEAAEMPKLYFSDNFHFSLPWKGKLAGRVMVTPQHSDDFFQMQGFVDYRQHLSPIFHTTADLIPNWLGFFKYYFNQLANNMTSYISINSYYIDGGKNLFWYQEFQNMGKIGTNYFTNKRLNINFKVGFKVKTLHLFYAIYNVEGRQFSTMGGMPFHNRLKIFGMEWSFTN